MKSEVVLIVAIVTLGLLAVVRSYVDPTETTLIHVIVGVIAMAAGVSGTLVAPRVASFLARRRWHD